MLIEDGLMGNEVGLTADVGGYQIGVSRTVPVGEEALWGALLSPEGMALWLGGPIELEGGATFALADGTVGEVRVYTPWSHIRLTWQPRGWARASTIQVRVAAAKAGTRIGFHQEQLRDATARATMKARWEGVIAGLVGMCGGGKDEG